MDWHWALATVVPLVAGWIWKVEQRLMRLASIEEDVKETRSDVKAIYHHLIKVPVCPPEPQADASGPSAASASRSG